MRFLRSLPVTERLTGVRRVVLLIIAVALTIGPVAACVLSVLSTGVWFMAEVNSGFLYSHPGVLIWNVVMRLTIFLLVALIVDRIRVQLHREKELSPRDPLTGCYNRKYLYLTLQKELERARREYAASSLSFSIGVVTCKRCFLSIDELIEKADGLMYAVKAKGKNDILYLEV